MSNFLIMDAYPYAVSRFIGITISAIIFLKLIGCSAAKQPHALRLVKSREISFPISDTQFIPPRTIFTTYSGDQAEIVFFDKSKNIIRKFEYPGMGVKDSIRLKSRHSIQSIDFINRDSIFSYVARYDEDSVLLRYNAAGNLQERYPLFDCFPNYIAEKKKHGYPYKHPANDSLLYASCDFLAPLIYHKNYLFFYLSRLRDPSDESYQKYNGCLLGWINIGQAGEGDCVFGCSDLKYPEFYYNYPFPDNYYRPMISRSNSEDEMLILFQASSVIHKLNLESKELESYYVPSTIVDTVLPPEVSANGKIDEHDMSIYSHGSFSKMYEDKYRNCYWRVGIAPYELDDNNRPIETRMFIGKISKDFKLEGETVLPESLFGPHLVLVLPDGIAFYNQAKTGDGRNKVVFDVYREDGN